MTVLTSARASLVSKVELAMNQAVGISVLPVAFCSRSKDVLMCHLASSKVLPGVLHLFPWQAIYAWEGG